jgi:hypothetical protein
VHGVIPAKGLLAGDIGGAFHQRLIDLDDPELRPQVGKDAPGRAKRPVL